MPLSPGCLPAAYLDLGDGHAKGDPAYGGPMAMSAPLAYKGLELMPEWFVVLVVVLAVIGIVLAAGRRGR
ncbi:hypothetical protein [Streptomyces sp. NPDC048720]|uniref:hypothetical protein n=1 Tax=Streptomyces sp. NPDC048720 TaxID=3365588 RepID=UPI00371FDD28